MAALAPLVAIGLLLAPDGRTPGKEGLEEEHAELAALFPEDTLLYVESQGFSELCEQGLAHPFVQAFLATELGAALTTQIDPEGGLALLDLMAGMPVLESLERLTTQGVALGVAGGKPDPKTVVVVRAASARIADEVREKAFDVLEEKTGYEGALDQPHARPNGARLWKVGESLVLQRGSTILLSNSRDYALRVDELARTNHDRRLFTRKDFQRRYKERSADAFAWAYADRNAIEKAFDTELDKLAQGNGHPGVHALLGAPIGALVTASTVTAELTLRGNELELALDGYDTDATLQLFPRADVKRPAASASENDLASALLYRDFGSILREGRELFLPRMVPKLAEAESQLSIFFSGQEVGSDVLPHVSPWMRLVSRPLEFESGPTPEIPLPGLALVARIERPDEIGPQFLAAFQSIVSIIGVDQAQKQGRPFLLSVDVEAGIPISYARFLDPYEGDGVDMRYNLRPACAVYEDTLILGTHEELVRELLREHAEGRTTTGSDTGEWLKLEGEPLGELIRANFEAMVMNKVLEEGVTREKAEEEIGGLELLVRSIRDLAFELPSPTKEHVKLSMRITLDDGKDSKRSAPMSARRASTLRTWRPASGEWNAATARHLFRRAGFGATPQQIDLALEQGFEATFDELIADDAPETALHRGIRSLLAQNEVGQLQAWWMALILSGQGAWRERLALVWHNHFATSFDKVDDVRLMHRQNELFRNEGAGDFRQLLHAIARDTAMLLWLDGNENKVGHPNENFAREVMELFGLGIGNYTEQDIQEAARALTGWGTKGRSSVFRDHEHDAGTKRFLGREGKLGAEDVIEAVLAQPACARHVAHRLLVEYVSPQPQGAWIDALAGELLSNDWDIGRTLRTLLSSELFFSEAARRSRIASPVELVATSARALEIRIAPQRAAELAASMGQALFRPPNVKGWDGHETWINVGTWIARHNAMIELVESLDEPESDPEEFANRTRETLLPELELDHLDDAVRHAARRAETPERAARAAAALVLTAPEYHFA